MNNHCKNVVHFFSSHSNQLADAGRRGAQRSGIKEEPRGGRGTAAELSTTSACVKKCLKSPRALQTDTSHAEPFRPSEELGELLDVGRVIGERIGHGGFAVGVQRDRTDTSQ